MNHITLITGFSIILLALSCKVKSVADELGNALLINCWTHSHEEDVQGEADVYRPCDFKKFPPAHYRNMFKLEENHQAEYSVLSPVDAHTNESGTWTFNNQTQILQIKNLAGEVVGTYQIEELQKDKLLVREIN